MNKQLYLAVLFSLGLNPWPAHAKDTPISKADQNKVYYGMGVDIGRNFKRLGLAVDLEALSQGLKDAYTGKKLSVSEEELRTIMNAYRTEVMQKQAGLLKATSEANQKAGDAFLADNAKKFGVITLPSGLQYKAISTGNGNRPGNEDTVTCHYRGKLLDGTEFDSSYRTGKPALFKLDGVIPGWKEALKLMPTGSKWQVFIPAKLAYGTQGAGRDIGPNATLIFEIELLSSQPASPKTTTP
jgi:FKBP-type peptidyl-prolyl cis-trans isomerase FklB